MGDHAAQHGREPKARPLALRLGGEERLEDAALDRLGDADAGVGDRQDGEVAAEGPARDLAEGLLHRPPFEAQRQAPTVGHRIAGIDAEVQDRVLELPGIARDDDRPRGDGGGEGDRRPERARGHLHGLAQQLAEVDG